MATQPERRRNRTKIASADQELIDHIRETFDAVGEAHRRLSAPAVQKLLRIPNSQVARRVIELFGAADASTVVAGDLREKVISLALGSDQAKVDFAFRINDQNGDGVLDRRDLDAMVGTALRAHRIRLGMRQRRALVRVLPARETATTTDASTSASFARCYDAFRRCATT